MTAITQSNQSPSPNPLKPMETGVFSPSASVEEAKSRFASALSSGVDKLMGLGHGRERASKQILHEISADSSPDEEEVSRCLFLVFVRLSMSYPAPTTTTPTVYCFHRLLHTHHYIVSIACFQNLPYATIPQSHYYEIRYSNWWHREGYQWTTRQKLLPYHLLSAKPWNRATQM